MVKRIGFLVALALFMFISWHTFIIEDLFEIRPVGETVQYWLSFLVISVLLFRKNKE